MFKSLSTYAALAALTVGGVTLAEDTGQKVERAAERTGNAVERGAERTAEAAKNTLDEHNLKRAKDMLKQVTEASLTKGGFDDLVERFVDADRNRIGTWIKDDKNKDALKTLDGRIAQFQKDWKEKYGKDFDIGDENLVFADPNFTIVMGEIGKDADLAGKKVPAGKDVTVDDLNRPKDKDGNTVKDTNLEKGRNVAYVTVKESHDLPKLQVPLVHELPDAWRIDVPDSVDGQKLYDNLLKHLTMANEAKDKWPGDVNEAYRLVSHHVLMAVIDVDKGETRKAGAELGGDKPVRTDEKKDLDK